MAQMGTGVHLGWLTQGFVRAPALVNGLAAGEAEALASELRRRWHPRFDDHVYRYPVAGETFDEAAP
jgi:hypothetical protein